MNKNDLIKRFCLLSTAVGTHFEHRHAHDCFCEDSGFTDRAFDFNFQFDENIFKFIEDAVKEKIAHQQKLEQVFTNGHSLNGHFESR